jgi:hypothetical protein
MEPATETKEPSENEPATNAVPPRKPFTNVTLALGMGMVVWAVLSAPLFYFATKSSSGEGLLQNASWVGIFTLFGLALSSLICGLIHAIMYREYRGYAIASSLLGLVLGIGALFEALILTFSHTSFGWGRPLRWQGKLLHPELQEGSDWTTGEQPSTTGLDIPTRRALEAYWLQDAQKEYGSVPAFARIGWLLSAVGAPPHLVTGAYQAALQETHHAQRCFAMASGYGGRSFTAQPLPELLVGSLGVQGNALAVLACESLRDGCLIEDFNADIAQASLDICQEPVAQGVLAMIAKEERFHGEFSWQLLEWVVSKKNDEVIQALKKAIAALDNESRPSAACTPQVKPFLQNASESDLVNHGRLPDEQWQPLWEMRLQATKQRACALLERNNKEDLSPSEYRNVALAKRCFRDTRQSYGRREDLGATDPPAIAMGYWSSVRSWYWFPQMLGILFLLRRESLAGSS